MAWLSQRVMSVRLSSMNTSGYLLTNNDPKVTSYKSTPAVISVVCQAFYWKDFGGFYIRFI